MMFEEDELAEDMSDDDIYTEEGMEEFVDNGKIRPWEQGFMLGYLGA